ncbi:hypothetical protein M901_0627 [Bacteriovorax sp. DB6_IX]|nr:hypothetical protein M901_0627 [Bacteriovorax sp. DB6_IX]
MRNWQKKLTYILISSVIIGAYIFFSRMVKKQPVAAHELTSKKATTKLMAHMGQIADSKETNIQTEVRKLQNCLEQKLKLSEVVMEEVLAKLNNERPAWENLHFKKNSQIYRLREFNDDGPNGDIRKLVLYKEDADNFPHIEEVFAKDLVEKRALILRNSEPIHKEVAYILDLEGRNFFIEVVNSKLNRLEINNINALETCKY